MLILDVRMVLFVVLFLLVLAVLLTMWRMREERSVAHFEGGRSGLALLDAAPLGILVLEADHRTYSNAYAQRLLHLFPGEPSLPEADWRSLLDEDRAALREAGTEAGRQRTVAISLSHTVHWWLIPYGRQEVVFLLDITVQQRVEQAGHVLINDLAHELRTPIATILTHLEILGLEDIGADLRKQSLVLSKEEAQRMARLVNDMLELGRLQTAPALVRRPLDLRSLAEEVVLQVTPRAVEQQMDLALEADAKLPLVNGDADRLRQVFLNLLDNALKYARPGDHVRVILHQEPQGIACAVCDTGPGIPDEHLPYVERRFYRAAPRAVEGSGLGLALVAEILRRHASRLEIESHTGERSGTCVRFVLPSESV